MAGASRIFKLIDEKPETDDGYVTLVNCKENPDGSVSLTKITSDTVLTLTIEPLPDSTSNCA